MNILKIFSLLLVLLVIQGCGAKNIKQAQKQANTDNLVKEYEDVLKNKEAIIQVKVPKGAFTLRESTVPEDYRPISLHLKDVTLHDVMVALSGIYDMNVFYDTYNGENQIPSIQAANNMEKDKNYLSNRPNPNKRFTVKYNGDVNGLLKVLSEMTGFFFVQENNVITVREKKSFSVTLPNYPDVLKSMENTLKNLGGENITMDELNAVLSFTSNFSSYKSIKAHLENLKKNASLVTMHAVMLSIHLSESHNMGIDWTQMSMNFGRFVDMQRKQSEMDLYNNNTSNSGSSSSSNNNNNNNNNNQMNDFSNFRKTGGQAQFTSTGASMIMQLANFSMSGFLNIIEQYGRSQLLQNIYIASVSGVKGSGSVKRQTPYISKVTVTALNDISLDQTTETDKADEGVELNVTPFYSSESKTLGMQIDLVVSGVESMVNLSTGKLQMAQPITTNKTMKTYMRLQAGQIAVLGGLIQEKKDSNTKGLPLDTYMTKALNKNLDKQELVVLVMPTIIEFIEEE